MNTLNRFSNAWKDLRGFLDQLEESKRTHLLWEILKWCPDLSATFGKVYPDVGRFRCDFLAGSKRKAEDDAEKQLEVITSSCPVKSDGFAPLDGTTEKALGKGSGAS